MVRIGTSLNEQRGGGESYREMMMSPKLIYTVKGSQSSESQRNEICENDVEARDWIQNHIYL